MNKDDRLISGITLGLSVLRRRGGPEPAYRCTAYPLPPVIYLGVSVSVAWASVVTFPRRVACTMSDGRSSYSRVASSPVASSSWILMPASPT